MYSLNIDLLQTPPPPKCFVYIDPQMMEEEQE